MLARPTTRILILLLLGAIFPGASRSQDAQAPFSADAVKAAFLVRFGEYVIWPSHPGNRSSFIITVLGAPSVAAQLRRMPKDRLIDGRTLEIREASSVDSREEEDILFIGTGASVSVARVTAAIRKPCLIVTEAPGGLEQGGMINFVRVDQRVRFEVSLPAAEAGGLKFSSRLLGVALNVKKLREGALQTDDGVDLAESAPRTRVRR